MMSTFNAQKFLKLLTLTFRKYTHIILKNLTVTAIDPLGAQYLYTEEKSKKQLEIEVTGGEGLTFFHDLF